MLFSKTQTKEVVKTVNVLGSKTVPSIVAYGQVEKIEGKNITLTNMGDSITVKIKDNAQIISFLNRDDPIANKQANFSDIKKGDTLNITVKVLPNGSLEGETAIILMQAIPEK